MRIVHICDGMPPATLGGAGAVMCGLAAEQSRRGHDIHLLVAMPEGVLPAPGPWTVHALARKGNRFAHWRSVFSGARAREVAAAVAAISPDVAHAHAVAFQIGYRWIPAVRGAGIPIVATFHDAMHVRYGKVTGSERRPALTECARFRWSYNPVRHAMIRRFLRSANALVAVSDALRTYLERYRLGRIETIRNGIDLSFWSATASRAEARASLGLPERGCIFLIAGRLGGEKGLSTAIAALPAGATLLVAGEAPASYGLSDPTRFRVFPRQSPTDMKTLYAACDAALVPSGYLDPFPTVCLEAMAMSRSVLATSMGGARESVTDGETGWILNPNDTDAWAKRMEWCSAHQAENDEIGKRGREKTETAFGIGRMADHMERVYAEAIGAR